MLRRCVFDGVSNSVRNEDFIAYVEYKVFSFGQKVQLAVDNCYQLVSAMDKIIPLLAWRIDI